MSEDKLTHSLENKPKKISGFMVRVVAFLGFLYGVLITTILGIGFYSDSIVAFVFVVTLGAGISLNFLRIFFKIRSSDSIQFSPSQINSSDTQTSFSDTSNSTSCNSHSSYNGNNISITTDPSYSSLSCNIYNR